MLEWMKPSWVRRADREAELRREAQKRAEDIEKDWVQIRSTRVAITREMIQNDWVATAKKVFGGS